MSRYIEADYLIDTIGAMIGYGTTPTDIWDMVNEAPTIDAVSVVRCQDCKYASDNKVYGCMFNHFNDNDWSYHRMYANDFCSYGERGE